VRELLGWYGIDVNAMAADARVIAVPNSHLTSAPDFMTEASLPLELDPSFNALKTEPLAPIIKRWGVVPLTFLREFANWRYTYGYVGAEDFTMYPLLPPGSFIQIDESRKRVVDKEWRSEYERPIYFVETREGHRCSWCSLRQGHLTLQPHPLSPEPVRIFRHPQDAEVIGEVVGMAFRRGDVRMPAPG
jgi:hypothetical protein